MSRAVENGGVSASLRREGEVRRAIVGTVEDDDFVVVEELHVHGRDAYTRLQEIPPPAGENR